MPTTRELTITLPLDMAEMVTAKVDGGQYASESDVIRDGLRVLLERDDAIERWLGSEVAAAYDAHKATPDHARPLATITAQLDAYMDEVVGKGA